MPLTFPRIWFLAFLGLAILSNAQDSVEARRKALSGTPKRAEFYRQIQAHRDAWDLYISRHIKALKKGRKPNPREEDDADIILCENWLGYKLAISIDKTTRPYLHFWWFVERDPDFFYAGCQELNAWSHLDASARAEFYQRTMAGRAAWNALIAGSVLTNKNAKLAGDLCDAWKYTSIRPNVLLRSKYKETTIERRQSGYKDALHTLFERLQKTDRRFLSGSCDYLRMYS